MRSVQPHPTVTYREGFAASCNDDIAKLIER